MHDFFKFAIIRNYIHFKFTKGKIDIIYLCDSENYYSFYVYKNLKQYELFRFTIQYILTNFNYECGQEPTTK